MEHLYVPIKVQYRNGSLKALCVRDPQGQGPRKLPPPPEIKQSNLTKLRNTVPVSARHLFGVSTSAVSAIALCPLLVLTLSENLPELPAAAYLALAAKYGTFAPTRHAFGRYPD